MARIGNNWVAYQTLVLKEVRRVFRGWAGSFLPPVITIGLYFIIFGGLIGKQIRHIEGFSYMAFIVPGLTMMAIITNSYVNVVFSVFIGRFQNSIQELLVSPISDSVILLGYVTGGMARGALVFFLVTLISLFFVKLHIHSFLVIVVCALLTSALFSMAGFANGLFARKFDDASIVPTFVLTPLTYLGGVFYSIHQLPPFWQKVSLINPILSIVNTFRYGFLGISDVNLYYGFGFLTLVTLGLFFFNLHLLKIGRGIRT